MTSPDVLFHVHTKACCDTRNVWGAAFCAEKKCPGCGTLHRRFRQAPIDVEVERKPNSAALNFAWGPLIGFMRVEFLALFETEVRQHLHLGRVFDRHGNVLPNFVTFIAERPLPLRGGPESEHRTCEVCDRFVYMADADRYVLRSDLTGQPIYQVPPCGLALTPELAARIERSKWKHIWISELPIRDTALDGIDPFPANYY